MKIRLIAITLGVLVVLPVKAADPLTDVHEIVNKANLAAYYQGDDGKATVKMTITNKQGQERKREFNIFRFGGRQREPKQRAKTQTRVFRGLPFLGMQNATGHGEADTGDNTLRSVGGSTQSEAIDRPTPDTGRVFNHATLNQPTINQPVIRLPKTEALPSPLDGAADPGESP